jgi:hypothetical protein
LEPQVRQKGGGRSPAATFSCLRTLHLAGRRQNRVDRFDGADGLPAPAGPFFIELGARIERPDAGDEQIGEELMIVLARLIPLTQVRLYMVSATR